MAQRGPQTQISQLIQAEKHRLKDESFDEACNRRANALKASDTHFHTYREILRGMKFLEGGRIQSSAGAPRETTMYNCFVAPTIPDSLEGIMDVAKVAAKTMKMGGGIGYDFSTLRPERDLITTLDTGSSGPLSFARIFDALCATIASAGHRRGAQMLMMRVDHPDIEAFVAAKMNRTEFTNFNFSVAITNEFMSCVENSIPFPLRFNGRIYKVINAAMLWEKIMRATWDWAEPGVIFIDRINEMNNLHYCETIAATNPCGEQPLPPNGACLLGSMNLTKYVNPWNKRFHWDSFREDIGPVVQAMDNVVSRSIYPTEEQRREAETKRRMGIGITGLANAAEGLGLPYGSDRMCEFTEEVTKVLTMEAYWASTKLAKDHGAFPAFDCDQYLEGAFIKQIAEEEPRLVDAIARWGIRNSHLTSIAPTGTISFAADNISSGIEPPYALEYEREQRTIDGPVVHKVVDFAYNFWGIKGRTATEVTAGEHVDVLCTAQKWIDSSVSKTCNVNPDMPWDEFKGVYMRAYRRGAKGCTTFNPEGKRFGILKESTPGTACYIDPETGERECS